MQRRRDMLLWFLALPGLMYACATTPDQAPFSAEGRIWPEPPAPPRIAFLQSFTQPEDLGIRPPGREDTPRPEPMARRLTTNPARPPVAAKT